jgi:hypothetical protein
MGRPKGSKNKAKNRPVVGHLIPTEGTDVPSQPDTSPAQDALASSASVAAGHAQEGGETAAPAVGDTVTHPDGRTGEVTEVEARGSGHAVSVLWAGDDDESQYTPTDWREMGATLRAAHAPTDPAPASTDEPIAPPVMPTSGRSLDEIGHEMADAQAQLDDLEAAKAAVVKDYGKRIGIVGARVSQLAAEYRQAERREEIDYSEGVVNVFSIRTGELLASRPLADSERQVILPLDHPTSPPVADVPEPVEDDMREPVEVEVEDESQANREDEET